MSDCINGGRRAYNAPTHSPAEDRLEITVHFDGEYNPHPIVLNRLDREVDYVEVDGERFERVRTCHNKTRYGNFKCDVCNAFLQLTDFDGEPMLTVDGARYVPDYCPHCGAKVKVSA